MCLKRYFELQKYRLKETQLQSAGLQDPTAKGHNGKRILRQIAIPKKKVLKAELEKFQRQKNYGEWQLKPTAQKSLMQT